MDRNRVEKVLRVRVRVRVRVLDPIVIERKKGFFVLFFQVIIHQERVAVVVVQ